MKAGDGKFSGTFENSELLKLPGNSGVTKTYASVGGLAETKNGYVTAFHYDGNTHPGPRAVYLGYTDKGKFSSKATKITAYDEMGTPVLAPTGLDGGCGLVRLPAGFA